MSKQIANTLQDSRHMLSVSQRNIVETKVPGSHAIDTSLKIDAVGGSGKYRTSVVSSRRDDPYKTKTLFSGITSSSKGETKANSLSDLQQIIGNSSDPHKSLLVQAVTEFISQGKILPANSDISMKKAFIDKGNLLAQALNNATNKVKDLRVQADNDLKNGVEDLNNDIKQLNLFNQTILNSRAPETLHNKRDAIIKNICKKLDVQVFFGLNGVAKLALKGGGHEIVSETGYAKFSYDGAKKEDILSGENIPDVTISHYGTKGNVISQDVPIMGGGDNSFLRGIVGGQIESLVNLRDVELPLAGEAIKSLVVGVAKAVNDVHNLGSTWPPKTEFLGTHSVRGGDLLDLEGVVSFFALDSKGGQLKGGAGRLHEAKIDFSTLKGTGPDGEMTVSDVIKEINQLIDLSPSRQRVALGEIKDTNGVQVPGEYLLNNIQLGSMGKVGLDGKWTFDLDLEGSSYFGSKIEVLEVTGPLGQLPTVELPQAFNLAKDSDTRTGMPITLGGFVPGGGPQNVILKIRVTGDNGVISDGTVTFQLDPTTIGLNDRVAFDTNLVPLAPNSGFVNAGLTSHSGVAKAMLVDDFGNEIDPTINNVPGKLAIKTNGVDYGLAIQGGNLSSLFGLNDFFEVNNQTGEINVKDSIINDVSQLSSGMAKKTDGVDTMVKIGDVSAKADIAFMQDFTAGDVVTIGGQDFTFVGGVPANSNEVQVDGNIAVSLANLVVAINDHPQLASKFTAVSDGINKLTITANTGGTWGNAVPISVALGNAFDTATINNGVPAQNVAGTLINGTDKTETIKVYDYTIGSGSVEALQAIKELSETSLNFVGGGVAEGEYSSTLQEFTTSITAAITAQHNQAKAESDILTASLEALYKEDSELFGSDPDEQYYSAMETVQFMKSIANLARMVNNVKVRVEDIIFG